jgi:hypothetical protein
MFLECIVTTNWPLMEEMRMETSGNILCLSATERSEGKEESSTKMWRKGVSYLGVNYTELPQEHTRYEMNDFGISDVWTSEPIRRESVAWNL